MPNRAYVIPYFYDKGKWRFILQVDNTKFGLHSQLELRRRFKEADLALFGGKLERGETYYEAADRELYEESLGIYRIGSKVPQNLFYVERYPKKHNEDIRIYFVYFDMTIEDYENDRKEFQEAFEKFKKNTGKYPEALDLALLDKKEFLSEALTNKRYPAEEGGHLWYKIVDVFRSDEKKLLDFMNNELN